MYRVHVCRVCTCKIQQIQQIQRRDEITTSYHAGRREEESLVEQLRVATNIVSYGQLKREMIEMIRMKMVTTKSFHIIASLACK